MLNGQWSMSNVQCQWSMSSFQYLASDSTHSTIKVQQS
jgi:hypothetical protein